MIGLLGGTFDPIHYGHLRTALEIRDALTLEEVRFLPCGIPPHRDRPEADALTRAALVARAIADMPGFVLDRRELDRSGPSYTYETLCSLREELGREQRLCLILGADAFAGLPDWHRAGEILALTHVIIARRPGDSGTMSPRLADLVQGRISEQAGDLRAAASGRVMWVEVTQLDISATTIRELLRSGGNPRYLMPDAVLNAIREQDLYRQVPVSRHGGLGVT